MLRESTRETSALVHCETFGRKKMGHEAVTVGLGVTGWVIIAT